MAVSSVGGAQAFSLARTTLCLPVLATLWLADDTPGRTLGLVDNGADKLFRAQTAIVPAPSQVNGRAVEPARNNLN